MLLSGVWVLETPWVPWPKGLALYYYLYTFQGMRVSVWSTVPLFAQQVVPVYHTNAVNAQVQFQGHRQ